MSSEPTRKHYDALASVYDRRWRRYIDATLAFALDGCALGGEERVLDVACGTGELEAKLLDRRPDLSVTAVDVSARMLDAARAKPFAARVTWHRAEAASLPYSDRSFDVVLCANALHYFRRPHAALAELRRVLRPGGRLRIVDWCDDYVACKLLSAWLRLRRSPIHRTYGLDRCARMVTEAGFGVERLERRRIHWIWGLMLVEGRAQ